MGLWFLFAKETAELVDGIRSAALAPAGERSGRVGDSARAAAASAGKFGLEQAGRRAANIRHKLRARRGSANLQWHLDAAVLATRCAAAEHFADIAAHHAPGRGTSRSGS